MDTHPATLKDFLRTIDKMFGLERYQEKEKAIEMQNRLSKLIIQSVLLRVLPELSEYELAVYEQIVESSETDREDFFNYLLKVAPNLPTIIQEEIEDLYAELMKNQ